MKITKPKNINEKTFSCGHVVRGFWMCAMPDWGQARLYELKDIKKLHSYLGKLIKWLEQKK